MKIINAVTLILIPFYVINAQVGINTTTPLPGTSLQIDGVESGVLLNRASIDGLDDDTLGTITLDMDYKGLIIYNTNTSYNPSPEHDVVEGYYVWDGSEWQGIGSQNIKKSGWVALNDANTTYNLPFVNSPDLTDFSNFTNIDLDFEDNAGDNIIESYAPYGYTASDFYDSTSTNRITGLSVGDAIMLRLQFDADPNNGNGVIVIQLDIGANDIPGDGDDIVIFQKSIPLVRGSGRITNVSETILLYQLGTFLANGAKLRMAYTRASQTTGTSCDVSNFGYVIKRLE